MSTSPGGGRRNAAEGAAGAIEFDVWGCRGSRSVVPPVSAIGNHTSCYSLHDSEDLFVFDAGRGLLSLAEAVLGDTRYSASVRRVHILVSHAHLDHWEGLKDALWFWKRANGLDLTLYAPQEALRAIRLGYAHPSYVPLGRLATGTLASYAERKVLVGRPLRIGGWTVLPFHLNHYSGMPDSKQHLDAVGFRLEREGGPVVAYLCDHEPCPETADIEQRATHGASLAVYDATYADVKSHAFGHGSQEHAASVARRLPETLVLAAHHNGTASDSTIRSTFRRHGTGAPNFAVAVEGRGYRWDGKRSRFLAKRG